MLMRRPTWIASLGLVGVLDMPGGGVKLIDNTLVVVLQNGEKEIEREPASPADALRVALMMLARRGRLEIGDVLQGAGAEANSAVDPEQPIVPAATKNFATNIAPFTQALILKTSPDRFDRGSGSACRLGFDSPEPT
jgi:hypothetical protein